MERVGGRGGTACLRGTPEESYGHYDITLTGNLPVPRAPEIEEGLAKNTPPPPDFPNPDRHTVTLRALLCLCAVVRNQHTEMQSCPMKTMFTTLIGTNYQHVRRTKTDIHDG